MPEPSSCLPLDPLITWGSGTAPTLNYLLPQKTCFATYGRISGKFPDNWFLSSTKRPPSGNFWDRTRDKEFDTLTKQISKDINEGATVSSYIGNLKKLTVNPMYKAEHKSGSAQVEKGAMKMVAERKVTNKKEDAEEMITLNPNQTISVEYIANAIKEGFMPVMYNSLAGKPRLTFVPKPLTPKPQIYFIEEYKTCAYLGQYGAGKVLNALSLLPGERTTLYVRTFNESESSRTYSQNILESMSDQVADSMEQAFSSLTQEATSATSAFSNSSSSDTSFDFSLLIVSYGEDTSNNSQQTGSTARDTFARNIENTIEQHVTQSNRYRSIDVSTSGTDRTYSSTEASQERYIFNPNLSRVLNIVYRQMVQEYKVVTYLKNVKIVFSNGYSESTIITDFPNLLAMLEQVIDTDVITVADAYAEIINRYCKIINYQGDCLPFLEEVSCELGGCIGPITPTSYWRISSSDTFTLNGAPVTVPGPILSLTNHILSTNSQVADALLGQGEALDCFNAQMQQKAVDEQQLQNDTRYILNQLMSSLDPANPNAKLELAKILGRLLSDCCDVPQTTSCCGDNNTTNSNDPNIP